MITDLRCIEILAYRDFYDIPQIFLGREGNRLLLFESSFDDVADDYEGFYKIYLMPELDEATLKGSWTELHTLAIKHLGSIHKTSVEFDESRRKSAKAKVP